MFKNGVLFLMGFLCLSAMQIENANASHTAGMDIFYRWVEDSTYEVTVVFYRNCSGISQPGSVSLKSASASISQNYTTSLPQMSSAGTGVPPLKPSNMLNCTDASNLCYEEYVYRGKWTSKGKADDWILSTQICCRPGGAAAPANILAGYSYIEAGLNNKDFPDKLAKNWSPIFHNRRPNHPSPAPKNDTIVNFLFRTVCAGNFYTIDQSTTEYQGDSVSYEFYQPQGNGGVNIAYIAATPWSLVNPMPTTTPSTLYINPVTGIIPVVPGSPTGTGIYVIGIKATEWRADTIYSGSTFTTVMKKIGYIKRDMTIWIDDASTCRKDSIHPKDITLTGGGGDTVLTVFFHNGISGEPNSLVRCASISEDGSEFRLLDYSNYVAPFDSTVRSIGVHRAIWDCKQGSTDRVVLHLAEPLRCQEYTVMLKKGSDLDVLESECGFLEPEFSTGIITVTKDVQVNIDTSLIGNPTSKLLSYCLPDDNAFPKLYGTSTDTSSFPLNYFWAFKCDTCTDFDTIGGQDTPFMWAQQEGWYEVRVRDPLNCVGDEVIRVVYDQNPSFKFELDPYCDKFGEPAGLPDVMWAPDHPDITLWEWWAGPNRLGQGDTLKSPQVIDDEWYKLIGTQNPKVPGAKSCSYTYEFYFGRDSFPPQDPLWVEFLDDYLALCQTDGDTGWLEVWIDGVRDKYAPLSWQWYQDTNKIPGIYDTIMVTDSGVYSIFMRDSLGCWDRDSALVTHDFRLKGPVIPCTVRGGTGTFNFIWPAETDVYANEVSLDGGLTWIPASNGNSHTITNVETQKFIKGRGLTDGACIVTDESTSTECPDDVFPPNVITPNGDGLNDVFNIPGLDLFANSRIKIYDRWGTIVFESENYKNDWSGGEQAEGTYYYVLKVDDPEGTIHKGVVTILR